MTIYEQQEGKCYYLGVPLVFHRYSDWQCSLERLNPDLGYIVGNVALIAGEFQHSTQWTIEKYQEFITLINIVHDPIQIDWYFRKERREYSTVEKFVENGIIYIKCKICENAKEEDQFYDITKYGCKACVAIQGKEYLETPFGYLTCKLSCMKASSKKRNHNPPSITIEDMMQIIDAQGGLCAYSGIPMTYGSYRDKRWTCSPERKDTSKGYTTENVCFVCWEFNTTDNTVRESEEIKSGSTGWSKEKIEFIKKFAVERAKASGVAEKLDGLAIVS